MAAKLTPSQLKSKIRQIESQRKQAIANYSQGVRKYNQHIKQAVAQYNNAVRQHNANVRKIRERIKSELNRMASQQTRISTQYTVTVRNVHFSYERVAAYYDTLAHPTPFEESFFDAVENENANNLETARVMAEDVQDIPDFSSLQNTKILDSLAHISQDLDNRWRGALYSLNPANPDATRHFCTSAREIFVEILEKKAPSNLVFGQFPNCEKTQQGTPTRRAKIRFLLDKKGIANTDVENFVDDDIENILELFNSLNAGTHGPAGKYSTGKLFVVKKRVEDGLLFLSKICL